LTEEPEASRPSIVLDRNEWEGLVGEVRKLAEAYNKLLTRAKKQEPVYSWRGGEKPHGLRKAPLSSIILSFFGLKPKATPARFCPHCGIDIDPRDRFCRICGKSTDIHIGKDIQSKV